jgi:queuine tRNA-ribosyltransferase
MSFKVIKTSKKSQARTGVLQTAHGPVKTPFFMPVATQGAIKHVSATEMRSLGAEIILSNAYHLMLKPGESLVKKAGGLHKFMDWPGAILTDSGGFQVFSLAGTKNRSGRSLVQLQTDGVKFRSYIDGREYFLTPERSFRIQADLGVDIAVCLDECVALPAKREQIKKAVELTTSWARKTKNYYRKIKGRKPLLFAVVQGGTDKEMRLKSLKELAAIGFDGYNIGGLAVGETNREMYRVLDEIVPEMPADKPRYLMGVGYPENIIEAVKRGVDMFDCVIPTREGRHGRLFLWKSKLKVKNKKLKVFDDFENVNILNAKFRTDNRPINSSSRLPELRNLSKAYLHYLFSIKEPLGQRLASLNNLEFYLDLMGNIRASVKDGRL